MISAGPGPVIVARGVGKVFDPGPAQVSALEAIELTVEPGEFVSLIGPSGCGKSTLLRIIGDLVVPTTGEVRVNGKPAAQARLDRDYGLVFQTPVLMDWRTVARNVELPLEIMGVPRLERARRAAELLQLVELEGAGEQHPWQLSGGMAQRVAIARALAPDPRLLLMDEPFGALDEMTRERLNQELAGIWSRTATTVLFVTHSIPEAVFLSTRILVMSARPGTISATIEVDLPQPRSAVSRETARFFELVTRVRAALRGQPPGDGPQPVPSG